MPVPTVTATDRRAAEIVRLYEAEGKLVRRVVIDGKRVEIEFAEREVTLGPDFVKW